MPSRQYYEHTMIIIFLCMMEFVVTKSLLQEGFLAVSAHLVIFGTCLPASEETTLHLYGTRLLALPSCHIILS